MLSPVIIVSLLLGSTFQDSKETIRRANESQKTLESFAEDDSKLRASYRELNLEHKRLSGLAAQAAACKAASVNLKSYEARQRNSAEAHRLQNLIDAAKPNYDKMEADFKEKQNDLLAKANAVLPSIRAIGEVPGTRSIEVLIQFTDLFIFDSKHEMPNIQASASFIDQSAWKEAAKALGKQGTYAIPTLKKELGSLNVGTKFAAAVALGDIGPAVYNTDKYILTQISELKSKTFNTLLLDRTEKIRRCKVLADAMDRIRPSK